jgi:enoyl-CoA hydratase
MSKRFGMEKAYSILYQRQSIGFPVERRLSSSEEICLMGVEVQQTESAAVVTLNWPGKRNSLSADDSERVAAAINEASATGASAIVLTGQGAFCAGGDLRAFADLSAQLSVAEIRTHVYGRVQAMVRALGAAPCPTIAAVDGPAIGLGMDLALACDMVFVGPDGWLQQGWGRAGLISATGGTHFLESRRRGSVWALLADQPRLDAGACVASGLGEAATPTALAAALQRAERLASLPAQTLAAYARIARTSTAPSDDYLAMCADYQAQFIGSPEFREFAAAHLVRG